MQAEKYKVAEQKNEITRVLSGSKHNQVNAIGRLSETKMGLFLFISFC